jgi:hypothetical protein
MKICDNTNKFARICVNNPLIGNAPYFIILLCLTPDNFTRQGESAATQRVNQTICPCTLLTL